MLTSGNDPPLRLGFFLERTEVMFPFLPGTFYRGVDRLPFEPTPEEDEQLRNSGKKRLLSLWQRYADLYFTGELHASLQLAGGLRSEFADEGVDFEVVYAEVVLIPPLDTEGLRFEMSEEILPRLRKLHEQVTSRPVGSRMLGFDLSYPLPGFHSALFQPGLRDLPEAPHLDVNSAGLLSDIAQVEELLPLANAMTSSWRPFCGIGVYLVA